MGPLPPLLGSISLGLGALILHMRKKPAAVVPAPIAPRPVAPLPVAPAPVPFRPAPALDLPPVPRPADIPTAPAPQSLPVFNYQADTRPMSDASVYYVDPSTGKHAKIDVHEESKALRFLGYAAPVDPSGGEGLNADRASGSGSFNPTLQAAVRQFQTDAGITADGWIGPQTIGMLSQAVAGRNEDNQTQNQSQGVPNASFAGWRYGEDPVFSRRRTRARALRRWF